MCLNNSTKISNIDKSKGGYLTRTSRKRSEKYFNAEHAEIAEKNKSKNLCGLCV